MNTYRAGSQTKIIRTYGKTTRRLINTHASLWSDDEQENIPSTLSKPDNSNLSSSRAVKPNSSPTSFSDSDDSDDSNSPESQLQSSSETRAPSGPNKTRAAIGRIRANVVVDSDNEEEVYVPRPTRRRARLKELDEEEVYIPKPTRRGRAGVESVDIAPTTNAPSVAAAEAIHEAAQEVGSEMELNHDEHDLSEKEYTKLPEIPPEMPKPHSPRRSVSPSVAPNRTIQHTKSPQSQLKPISPHPIHPPPTPITTQTSHPNIKQPLPSHVKLLPTSHDFTPPHLKTLEETPLTTRRGSLGWSISPIAGMGLPSGHVGFDRSGNLAEGCGSADVGGLGEVSGFAESWVEPGRRGGTGGQNEFADMEFSIATDSEVVFSPVRMGGMSVEAVKEGGSIIGTPIASNGSERVEDSHEGLMQKLQNLDIASSRAHTSDITTASPLQHATTSQRASPSPLSAPSSSPPPTSPHPKVAKVRFNMSYQSSTGSDMSTSELADAVGSIRLDERDRVIGGMVGSPGPNHNKVVDKRDDFGDPEAGSHGNIEQPVSVEPATVVEVEVDIKVPDKAKEKEKERKRKKEKRKEDRRNTMARRMTLGGDRRIKKEIGLDDLLELCDQSEPKAFDEVLEPSAVTRKLGEATYSEVFSLMYKDRLAALKIIPFGDLARGQPDVAGVVQEVKVARCLGRVGTGFVEMLGVGVCRGPYHERLLELWDLWAEEKESENDRPDEHPDHQLYALLFLTDGGRDLEHVIPTQTTSHAQIRSILLQIMCAIAEAERQCRFEHRDLHWGNVLVRFDASRNQRRRKWVVGKREENEGGRWEVEVEDCGVEVTIIDFTLGRVDEGGETCFVPLDDEDFFTGKGKGKRGGDLQFDIYRWMRMETRGRWEDFHPKTNVFWIHYLIDKFLTSPALFASSSSGGRGKGREEKKELIALRERVLDCGSVCEVLEVECAGQGSYFGCGEGAWEVRKV